MKKLSLGILLLGLVCLPVATAQAVPHEECNVCNGTTSDNRWDKTRFQLTRGLGNVAFSWMELFRQPVKETEKEGGNLVVGMGKGVGHTLLRLAMGAGETITAPMPKASDGSQIANDCPLCMNG